MKSETLKPISNGKSVTVYSPLASYDETFARTGTCGSYVHAILYACNKEYSRKEKAKQTNFAKKFLKEIKRNEKIPQENQDEEKSKLVKEFYTTIGDISHSDQIKSIRSKMNIGEKISGSIHEMIAELLPVDKLDKDIYDHFNKLEEIQSIKKSRADYFLNEVNKLTRAIDKSIESNTVKEKPTNEDLISLIGETLKTSIYVMDCRHRVPQQTSYINKNGSKSVIIMKMNEDRYEVISRLLVDKKLQREFDNKDIIITKMNLFLEEPDSVGGKYPELKPYTHNSSPPASEDECSSEDDDASSDEN
jgi:uncharacterized protein YfeS